MTCISAASSLSTSDGITGTESLDPRAFDAAAAPSPGSNTQSSNAFAGEGPNEIQITNTQDHPITVGKFQNGESTTDPSACLTLQPGQTGSIFYANGEAGIVVQADASGRFRPDASRLEYEADADGKMLFPDVSYIDGRNASISLTDGAGLEKGDDRSIAALAPVDLVSVDAAGNKTIAGWYDGSTVKMQQGGEYLESQLGTSGSYIHPNDDTRAVADNPMSGTQSHILKASFGAA